jgi:squalene-associated FAD-dependent desaturase
LSRAFVLGGGVAGIAAAFLLRDRGHTVTLLESHGWLGGRAFSFVDQHAPLPRRLDNGPHVLLGCYRELRRLLARIGSDRFAVARSLQLGYRLTGGGSAHLRLATLPTALALPSALWRLPLSRKGRWRALRGCAGVLLGAPAAWTLRDWLERRGQLGEPAEFFWLPLCRAVMNTEPEHASARLFLSTLRQAFGGSAASGAMWAPTRPWSEVLGEPALLQLRREGIEVRLSARVTAFELRDGAIATLQATDPVRVGAGDVVVSAMPWHALAPLLPHPPAFAGLQASPIVSLHCDVEPGAPAPPDDGPVTSLVAGDPFHFLCRTPGEVVGRFALVAGGSRAFDGMSVADIEAAGRAQLARYFPGFEPGAAMLVRVSKEARATIVPSPMAQALRPKPGRLAGGPSNLFVCGDWTACGLPSTLEGAARSAAQMLANAATG